MGGENRQGVGSVKPGGLRGAENIFCGIRGSDTTGPVGACEMEDERQSARGKSQPFPAEKMPQMNPLPCATMMLLVLRLQARCRLETIDRRLYLLEARGGGEMLWLRHRAWLQMKGGRS